MFNLFFFYLRRVEEKKRVKRKEGRVCGESEKLNWDEQLFNSCFLFSPLTFPAVSVLVGCRNVCVCVCVCLCVCVWDIIPVVSDQVITMNFLHEGEFLLNRLIQSSKTDLSYSL